MMIDYQNILPIKIFSQMGPKIGSGIDGDVFEYQTNKVIKISKIINNMPCTYSETSRILCLLKQTDVHAYARVYEYGYLGLILDTELYYYVTDKLNSISEDEWKVFHSLLSHEDRNIEKNYTAEKIIEILSGLSVGLDFDQQRVIFFLEALKNSKIKHLDLHPRNIMKDNTGNFKLVDFNRTKMEKT